MCGNFGEALVPQASRRRHLTQPDNHGFGRGGMVQSGCPRRFFVGSIFALSSLTDYIFWGAQGRSRNVSGAEIESTRAVSGFEIQRTLEPFSARNRTKGSRTLIDKAPLPSAVVTRLWLGEDPSEVDLGKVPKNKYCLNWSKATVITGSQSGEFSVRAVSAVTSYYSKG